jgi:hypothetical protein
MPTVNPSQSNPGDEITAAAINTPINQLAAVINGGIDSANLAPDAVASDGIAQNAVQADDLAPNVITLGYAQITANFTTASTSPVSGDGSQCRGYYSGRC